MKLRGPAKPIGNSPLQLATLQCVTQFDRNELQKCFIDEHIGYGTFTTKTYEKGDFLVEYRGELISVKEGRKREKVYPDSDGSFLFFFQMSSGQRMCVDATYHNGLGKMVNDSPMGSSKCNSKMVVVMVDSIPHLCLFATKDIKKGEELRYDYGVPNLPWRKKVCKQKSTRKRSAEQISPESSDVPSAAELEMSRQTVTTEEGKYASAPPLPPELDNLTFC